MSLARHSRRRWEEAWPNNLCGKARALTEIGPLDMKGRAYLMMRIAFLARRYIRRIRSKAKASLDGLAAIHFARWAVIEQLPDENGDPEPLDPKFLYFESNFNGGFDEYIDAFSYVIPGPVTKLFGPAVGFPGVQPATEFKAFIRLRGYEAEHYFSAYPEATATEVHAALRTLDRLQPVLDALDSEPEAFARTWRRFLAEARP